MVTREYVCIHCKYEFEELQKISDDIVRDCPFCLLKGGVESRYSNAPTLLVQMSDPKTVGGQAIKNERDMGSRQYEEKLQTNTEEFYKKLYEKKREGLAPGENFVEPKFKNPIWRDKKVDLSLAELPEHKQMDYVMTGDK